MKSGNFLGRTLALAAIGWVSGCAQTDNIFPSRTTMGTLKTSVSQLEYENEQLRSNLAKLKAENRAIEDRLVETENDNGDLVARLNDAKHELRQRGYDFDSQHASAGDSRDAPASAPRTLPAGRSNRKPRKTPFAKIPGSGDSSATGDPADDGVIEIPPSKDDFGPQSSRDDTANWLPVARGTSEPSTQVR